MIDPYLNDVVVVFFCVGEGWRKILVNFSAEAPSLSLNEFPINLNK